MPVIANGGYYGAPGVTAAGAYGATPVDMLYSLRNQGWSDQQIMDTYGPNDPMVRIMQLERQQAQAQPSANGYRYQYPQQRSRQLTQADLDAQYQRSFGSDADPVSSMMYTPIHEMEPVLPPEPQPIYTPYGTALPAEQAVEVSRQNIRRAGTPSGIFEAIMQSLGFR